MSDLERVVQATLSSPSTSKRPVEDTSRNKRKRGGEVDPRYQKRAKTLERFPGERAKEEDASSSDLGDDCKEVSALKSELTSRIQRKLSSLSYQIERCFSNGPALSELKSIDEIVGIADEEMRKVWIYCRMCGKYCANKGGKCSACLSADFPWPDAKQIVSRAVGDLGRASNREMKRIETLLGDGDVDGFHRFVVRNKPLLRWTQAQELLESIDWEGKSYHSEATKWITSLVFDYWNVDPDSENVPCGFDIFPRPFMSGVRNLHEYHLRRAFLSPFMDALGERKCRRRKIFASVSPQLLGINGAMEIIMEYEDEVLAGLIRAFEEWSSLKKSRIYMTDNGVDTGRTIDCANIPMELRPHVALRNRLGGGQ
mmetsp:Transcript_29175/g.49480  ORF Transcript_29175/g.49480 Transcript_29175/m.49480 type:complete len:370 (+) Transcript_29175:176-1285(+)